MTCAKTVCVCDLFKAIGKLLIFLLINALVKLHYANMKIGRFIKGIFWHLNYLLQLGMYLYSLGTANISLIRSKMKVPTVDIWHFLCILFV